MNKETISYPGFWIRGIAFLLDLSLLLSVNYILCNVILNISNLAETLIMLLFSTVYFFAFTYFMSQTIGKMIIGIKVISLSRSKLCWEDVLLREIIGKFISCILLFLGLILIAFDPKKQSLHDKLSQMQVVWDMG